MGPGATPAQPQVQFFNPAAIPAKKAGPAGAAGAPTEQMAGMNIGGRGPAQAFSLGEIPQCPQDGIRHPQSYIEDQVGQSNPRYMQCSVGAIPASQAVAQKFSLPIAVTIHPLNDPPVAPGFSAVPVVNFANAGVIRCRRCRTYINPFVTWLDAGRRWRCNVCGLLNDVPADYYCSLDSSGKRRDHAERPELNFGSVEYVAPADYMVRPPQPPTYVFCIDVSARSVQSGLLTEVANTILANLDKLPGGTRTQIGFVTFDSSFHFYCLKSSLQDPQMLCVADLDDPFLPLPSELLVNLTDSREQVESLLRKLPGMFSDSVNPDSAFYPALQAATAMMQHVGGKLTIFHSVIPSLGRPTVRPREETSVLGSEHEAKILNPANDVLKTHALEVCSKNQISVDVFCCCEHYTDLATISPLCKYTNGQLWHYPGFYAARDADTLRTDLTRALTRQMAFEAVLRVRASRGIKVQSFHGNHYLRGADLLALPTCDLDKSFCCDLMHEEQNLTCSHVCIQSALLYTTSDGERRIRVHNLNVPVTQNFVDLYSTIDVPTTMNSLLKSAIEQAQNTKLIDARSKIQSACVQSLRAHRLMNNCPLPDRIKLLPLYILAALKNPVLRDGVAVRSDDRVNLMMQVGSFPTAMVDVFLYPSMYAVHRLLEGPSGTVDGNGEVVLPPCLRLTQETLEAHGIYLLDNGMILLLWIGKMVDRQLLVDVLNVNDAERLDGAKVTLPILQSEASRRLVSIVNKIRSSRPYALPLYTIRQGGASEQTFHGWLVEDRTLSTMSYSEWWDALGRQLQ